jgi:hypothetical protein
MVKPILASLSYHYRNEMSKRQKSGILNVGREGSEERGSRHQARVSGERR